MQEIWYIASQCLQWRSKPDNWEGGTYILEFTDHENNRIQRN